MNVSGFSSSLAPPSRRTLEAQQPRFLCIDLQSGAGKTPGDHPLDFLRILQTLEAHDEIIGKSNQEGTHPARRLDGFHEAVVQHFAQADIISSGESSGARQYAWSNANPSGSYNSYYGNSTALAVQAFEIHGHPGNQADDPFSEAVKGGIDYLTANLYSQTMFLRGGENPDSNGNSIGLSWNSDHPISETGAIMDTLVASGSSDSTARTGNANLIGRKYKDIVQDMADMLPSPRSIQSWQ